MPFKNSDHRREYARLHYVNNKKKYLESNRRRRSDLKEYIRKLKESTSCKDCGLNYPHYVMDFDHLRDKEALIKKFVHNNNRVGLMKEIKKCEIVCSNCHRKRTYRRLQDSLKSSDLENSIQ